MRTLEDPQKIKEVNSYSQRIVEVNKDFLQYWKEHTLWHWDFWVALALTVIPWLVWLMVRKKESQARLLAAGSFTMLISSWFDFLGVSTGLWFYTGRIVPTMPSYVPWDFCLMPVTVMLFLQFKTAVNPWIKALVFGAMAAFVGEPIFEWLGFYSPEKWSSFYSFPIYGAIYLMADRISRAKTFAPL